MKNIILIILLINNPVQSPHHIKAIKEDTTSFATQLNISLSVKTKSVKDIFCNRYSAYGLYFGAPQQSYYYAKCLKRYAKLKKKTLYHAITSPFMFNEKPSGGGFAITGHNVGSRKISVSTFLPWNYLSSVVAIWHEALGHGMNRKHTPDSCFMHPEAAGKLYTGVCK